MNVLSEAKYEFEISWWENDGTKNFTEHPIDTKYGSAEASPDPVNGLLKLRNEIYALNRYSIEVFDNVGTSGFPFQRVASAIIDRGCIGTHASCVFLQSIAFLGGGLNEAPAIWLGNNATTVKVSTREVEQVLQEFTEEELNQVIVEVKVDKGHQHLYIHLPDRTLVYDAPTSSIMGAPVWFTLSSCLSGNKQYRAKNFVYCYNKWLSGDPTSYKHGELVDNISSQIPVANFPIEFAVAGITIIKSALSDKPICSIDSSFLI